MRHGIDALLHTMMEHIATADEPSAQDMIQIVASLFVRVFQPPQHRRGAGPNTSPPPPAASSAGLASTEEQEQEALELAMQLYTAAADVPWLLALVQSQHHHPTAALFLQGALAVGFPASTHGRRSSLDGQLLAQALCQRIASTVGMATCRLLLPGVASSTTRYVQTYLPRKGAHTQSQKALLGAIDTLTLWVDTCFGLDACSMRGAVKDDDPWAVTAIQKLTPLMTRVLLDPLVLQESVLDAPIALSTALAALSKSLCIVSMRTQPTATEHPTLVAAWLFLCDTGRRGVLDGVGQTVVSDVDPLRMAPDDNHRADVILRNSWATLLEDVCIKRQRWSSDVLVVLKACLVHTGSSMEGGIAPWMAPLLQDDAATLWNLVRRALNNTLRILDVSDVLTKTPTERSRSLAAENTRGKSFMDLLDELLAVVGWFAQAHPLVEEALHDAFDDALEDWEAFSMHPVLVYAVSRVVVGGSLTVPRIMAARPGPPDGAHSAVSLLDAFASTQRFERLWETIAKPHLWAIELDWDRCTFQQLQHRSVMACTILGAIRWVGEALEAVVAQQQRAVLSEGGGDSFRGCNLADHHVFERMVVLCVYNVVEKASCGFGDVHEAAEETLKSLTRLQDKAVSPLGFFCLHGRTIADETRRAILDPDLHDSAVRVVSGFTRFAEKHIAHLTSTTEGGGAVASNAREHVCAFAYDVLLIATNALEGWSADRRDYVQYRHGCLCVIGSIGAVVLALTKSAPRVWPSTENWDDEQRWTASEPAVARLQEAMWTALMDRVYGHCLISNSALAVKAVGLTVSTMALFLEGDNKTIVRTHLNTLHRAFQVMEQLLVGKWSPRKDDALQLLALADGLIDVRCEGATAADVVLAPGSKRTKRSTLTARGRWLAELSVPVEVPDVMRALVSLLSMAPSFLLPRMVQEATPAVLLWYVRSAWLVSVPTTREELVRAACINFLQEVRSTAAAHGFQEDAELLRAKCVGIVKPSHWPQLYEVDPMRHQHASPSESGGEQLETPADVPAAA